MKRNEIEIVRALSVKLSEDTVFVLTYQYHTEKDPNDPAGKRNDRARSRYRMLGRVMKVKDVEDQIRDLHSDANRTKPWKWPDDPSWDGEILYMKDSTNEGQSNWLRLKLRKAVSKEEGALLMKGYKKNVALAAELKRRGKKGKAGDVYTEFTPNAVYDSKGYACSDGTAVDADDFETLVTKVGQNVWKEIKMKLVGPGAKPFPGRKKEPEAPPAEDKKDAPEVVSTT